MRPRKAGQAARVWSFCFWFAIASENQSTSAMKICTRFSYDGSFGFPSSSNDSCTRETERLAVSSRIRACYAVLPRFTTMKAQFKVGRIAGISIGLHYSWFLIAVLIALSLAQHFRAVAPQWSTTVVWMAAVVTGLLFFAALLLHELAHSLLAKARGLRVRAITLFALGGVSQIETEASDAKSEFWIAIAGPITSVAIGLVVLGTAWLTGWQSGSEPTTPTVSVLVWLGYINIMLAAFNMIPGYPLDGGRVLRAIIWWITRNADRSTRLAAKVGQAVAFMFILSGLYRFFVGANFGGLWLAFIGWFLLDASRSSYVQVELMAGLRDRRVADIMDSDYATVEGHVSLQDFVDEHGVAASSSSKMTGFPD
jgi:Zn-dependent protease